MDVTFSQSLLWCVPALLIIYYLAIFHSSEGKKAQFPVAGCLPRIAPRFFHNLDFAKNAASILQTGYQKFKASPFQVIRNQGNATILPPCLLEELASIPSTVASPNAALESDLLGSYTGLDLILESRIHHTVVQRKLTPRLGLVTPLLEEEMSAAFDDYFKNVGSEWSVFQPYQVFGGISARLASCVIVGSKYCRNEAWLDLAFNYTENLFRTIVVLRLFPTWTHGVICRALPSFWQCQRYIRLAKKLLGGQIADLLHKDDQSKLEPGTTLENANVLHWLIESAKGNDRDPDTIAHVEVLMVLASVHTTLLRMVNVLYDTTESGKDLSGELLAEMQQVAGEPQGWSGGPYDRLYKLDSTLRESQRMSPPTTLGMKRMFLQPHTFSNGLHVPRGTYVCMPSYAVENDPGNTPDPEVFDALRTYRKWLEMQDGPETPPYPKELLFSSPEKTTLNFGFGKSACPGRFFASLILKMFFVKLLSEYEFKFMPNSNRPSNLMAHEFLFCWPWQKMLVRRKESGACPF